MSTAAALTNLLRIRADINHYTQEQIYYSTKQEANTAKMNKYAKYETNWEKAYDDAMQLEDNKSKSCNGVTVTGGSVTEAQAEVYANAKVRHRNEELYLELCDLDIEYDSMNESINTLIEELRADEESAKQNVSTEAQDTHLQSS